MPPAKPPRRRYHHGDLREALVAAALKMADEEGVAEISTRALARKLGVSHAAPARHFPSRTGLLAEVAARAFEVFGASLTSALSGDDDAPGRLAATGRAYVRFGLDHPGLIRLMFDHGLAPERPSAGRLQEAGMRAYAVLESVARDVLPRSARADAEKVARAALLCWSVVHGAVTLFLDGPLATEGDAARALFLERADAAIAMTVRALRRD